MHGLKVPVLIHQNKIINHLNTNKMQTIKLNIISSAFEAYLNCIKANNTEIANMHKQRINELLVNLPSGYGIDTGIKFDWQNSKPQKLIFNFRFYHMNDTGYYTGNTDHSLVIIPEFQGFSLLIKGKDKNQIKEYLYDLFYSIFTV